MISTSNELSDAQRVDQLQLKCAAFAHDFNNLLTAMMGNLSLALAQLPADSKLHSMLEVVHKASVRAQAMVKHLLLFAKQDSVAREFTDMAGLLRESVALLQRGARCPFVMELEPDLPWVAVNPVQMTQVINNLLINANQASPQGGPIVVRAKALKPEALLQIEVQDHGTGVDPEHLQKLFVPYFTTKSSGNGLGLASVKAIVEDHGGTISVASTLGQGTTFTFCLPIKEMALCPVTSEAPLLKKAAARLLLLDDEPTIQQIAAEMLQHLGHSVVLVKDGATALQTYKQAMDAGHPFDAVILDLAIPGGKGGREIIEDLRLLDPKVLALVSSGYSEDPIVKNCQQYGFSGVLMKPYNLKALEAALACIG